MASIISSTLRHYLALKCGDSVRGIATAGAAGSITDSVSRREDANFWDGAVVYIYAGTGIGQERLVSSSTAAGVLNVAANWTTTPDATSRYELHRIFSVTQYDDFIAQAIVHLTGTRKWLQPGSTTTTTWVTDTWDYALAATFVAVTSVEVATVSGTPQSDEYEFIPREAWHVREGQLVFEKGKGQYTNGYKFRVNGWQEITVPSSDTSSYTCDPQPLLEWAYYYALQARAEMDPTGYTLRLLERQQRAAEEIEARMPDIQLGDARIVARF